jgi:hypothetical protein
MYSTLVRIEINSENSSLCFFFPHVIIFAINKELKLSVPPKHFVLHGRKGGGGRKRRRERRKSRRGRRGVGEEGREGRRRKRKTKEKGGKEGERNILWASQ